MFLLSDSIPLIKVEKVIVIVTLLTLQNVIGGDVRARRVSGQPYRRAAKFDDENLTRLRRTASNDITGEVNELPSLELGQDYVRPDRLAYKGTRWNNGIVPYTIDRRFTSIGKAIIAQAFEEYARKTCIRFVPKTSKHKDYVDIQVDYDPDVCGRAPVCRQGGKQWVKIGTGCTDLNTVLHELAHALCMSHEHKRPDRDKFIKLPDTTDKNSRDFKIVGSDHTTLGLMYDYESVMHYGCPYYARPKTPGVVSCGQGKHLSVLDAEKINSFYECGGCHSYRFRQPAKAQKDIIAIAGYDTDGTKLGVCRGYFNADIVPGKYRIRDGECHVPWGRQEHKITQDFEVLTLPQPELFSWVPVKNGRIPKNAVPGGRENGGIPLYIGRCFVQFNGKNTRVPGKIHKGSIYFSYGGKEYTCQKYEVFVCNKKT